jgi:hypothetical protein
VPSGAQFNQATVSGDAKQPRRHGHDGREWRIPGAEKCEYILNDVLSAVLILQDRPAIRPRRLWYREKRAAIASVSPRPRASTRAVSEGSPISERCRSTEES